jgi:hypothetical protein
MRERFFEAEQMNTKKAVQRDLEDAGISHPSEWRKALDLETPLAGEEPLKVEQRETRLESKEGKIEDKTWQSQLDVAFEHGDYSLIQTLRRVRPESIPNPEIIRNKLNELVVSRPSRWVEEIEKIRSVVNIEADPTVLSQEFGKLLEQFGQEKGILDQLKTFKKATGYTPEPELVQARFRGILAGKKSYSFDVEDLFNDIKNLTGIKPDSSIFNEVLAQGDIGRAKKVASLFGVEITSDMIQRAYEDSFAKNGYLDTNRISEIGEKPNAELVQRAYQKIVEKRNDRWLDSIQNLRQATGIQPIFTEEQVLPFLEERLSRGWYDEVKKIVELTGIKPDVALVQARALKVVDDGHGYIDQGKRIREGIKHLSESVGVEFEIPESEIQDRYQKAIADKKPHIITNLYGAFEINPSVDRETARQFLVELMSETYHNPIAELEKVFGVKFKATPEEIEAKYDENLEKFNFDSLAKIKELTGKDVDGQKLEASLARWFEKEATVSSEKRPDYNSDWEKKIKQRLEQFNITIPPEVAINIYTSLIQNETAHSSNLIKVYQISGTPIPEGLAQQAYRKYLSSDYAYSIKTGQGSSRGLGSVSGAFEELFKISGIKPEIPNDVLQSYYRGSLEEDSWYGRGIHSIQKIAEIAGVQPEFDPNDINRLYKQLVLSGREDRIRSIREATHIELQLDEETLVHVSQQIEAGIEKVRSGDYEKEEYREKKFDTYSLEQDLRKVSSLTAATGIKPDSERLQSAYSEILGSDPYWATKIEQIVKATGIKPVFSPEQLQAKGQQLLEQGSLRSFERLQAYGQITFTPEVVAKTYDALLTTNRRYDEYDRKHYYNEDWVDRIKRFKETTGIAPTETQLAEIFSHISQDGQVARSRYGDRVEETIKFFSETFQTEITGGMVKDIAISYLARGDVNSMKKFIEKVGVTPELTDEDILPHVSRLMEAKELNSLAYLKQEMKLARLPVTETVVQSTYQHFASQEDFGKESSKSLQAFKQIFELTGIPANFSAEQTDRVYKTSRFVDWQKLNEVIGALPSNEVVQYKYLQFFTGGHYGLEKNISALQELTGEAVTVAVVKEAIEKYMPEVKTEEMAKILQVSGIKPEINPQTAQLGYRKIAEDYRKGRSVNSSYWGEKMIKLFDLVNDNLGIPPDKDSLTDIFLTTLGETDYIHAYNGQDGKRVYPQFWQYLISKFGKPDPEVVQRIYLAQLAA